MLQDWLEMKVLQQKRYNNAVWIPLYANRSEESGDYGYSGYKEECFGCGTLALPNSEKNSAHGLGWMEVGLPSDHHMPYVDDNKDYKPAGLFVNRDKSLEGVYLVLKQFMEKPDISEWHLNQDFVLALGLKREADTWLRPSEGYAEAARLRRNPDGTPCLLEVRAEYLKDYLCARNMFLLLATYRQRVLICAEKPTFSWGKDSISQKSESEQWEGYIREIHEGGHPFGEEIAVFHSSRTDVDPSEDVPIMGPPSNDNIVTKSWTRAYSGDKLYYVSGARWKNEWIEPSQYSTRIAYDELPPTVYFITDAEGKRENRETLKEDGRWLWFRPTVIVDLIERRGGVLAWYTAHTGEVGCLQNNTVHFGINSLGLINVYAKDIAYLPDWQQQIWAGHNITPDGKVSPELLASQVNATPADTQAPEAFLERSIMEINSLSEEVLGFSIFKEHDAIAGILGKCHRFRAINVNGLYSLAKDLARITADTIDSSQIQKIVHPPKGEKWGSLKSLENLIATKTNPAYAHKIMGLLVGIYELRLADAHLPSGEIENALKLARVDPTSPFIYQGFQILNSCVGCLCLIVDVLKKW